MSALDIARIKEAAPLSSIVARYVKLVRAGREWKACCPFHEDRTPSFTVNDHRGFYCFGCGEHGDVLDFIQKVEGVGLRRAAEILGDVHFEVRKAAPPPSSAAEEPETQAQALRIWRDALPIAGTPAETYLRSRGLLCRLPECLRFARLRYGRRGPFYNALVALAATFEGTATGIQRTFLNEAGTGKAGVPKPKLSLGRISGSAVRLAPQAREMIVCEGLEDGLTLQQEIDHAVWVAAGVGNLCKLELPIGVRTVTIAADNDAAGEAGALKAAQRFVAEGREARIIRPIAGFKDFNAELMGRPRCEYC